MGIKVNEIYSSPYLSGADLGGQRIQVRITSVEAIEVQDFRDKSKMVPKILVAFEGYSKKMLLGKQNAHRVAELFGNDTDAWISQTVEVYAERQDVSGTMRDVLKVSPPQQVVAQPQAPGV